MSTFRIRPRIQYEIPVYPDHVISALSAWIARDDYPYIVTQRDSFFSFYIALEEQHFWSPVMTVQITEIDESSLVKALFGPKPAVWTMFAFLYSATIIIGTFALMFGMSQQSLDLNPWGFWLFGFCVILCAGLYILSQLGQNMTRHQMIGMKEDIENFFSNLTQME